MTEPATIKYTGGASWIELSDGSNTKAVVLKNYRNAVEYFAYLCQKFGWNPEKDGVILPIRKDTPAGTPQTTQTLSIFGKSTA